jgi:hypothetical protein
VPRSPRVPDLGRGGRGGARACGLGPPLSPPGSGHAAECYIKRHRRPQPRAVPPPPLHPLSPRLLAKPRRAVTTRRYPCGPRPHPGGARKGGCGSGTLNTHSAHSPGLPAPPASQSSWGNPGWTSSGVQDPWGPWDRSPSSSSGWGWGNLGHLLEGTGTEGISGPKTLGAGRCGRDWLS